MFNKVKMNEQLYLKAVRLACRLHALQTYGDNLSYDDHLYDVEQILIEFGHDSIQSRIEAWLHDILEDCDITYNDIKTMFGEEVADTIYCVTDELGKNRKERKQRTLPKINSNERAKRLKLADRIGNGRRSKKKGHSMFKKYQIEYPEFKNHLHVPGEEDAMWKELDKLFQ